MHKEERKGINYKQLCKWKKKVYLSLPLSYLVFRNKRKLYLKEDNTHSLSLSPQFFINSMWHSIKSYQGCKKKKNQNPGPLSIVIMELGHLVLLSRIFIV